MSPDRPGRLLALVDYLSGRRARSPDEIAERFGYSKRSVYRDLNTLHDYQVPLVRDERGYRLLETARLQPLGLTVAERAILRLALHNPLLERHATIAPTLKRLRSKLAAADEAASERPEALALAPLDRSGPSADTHLDGLRAAIESGVTVEMRYRSLAPGGPNRPRWRRVDPYRVFHRADAWYLAGHCHRNGEPRTFRLDRIEALRRTDTPFEPAESFDLDAYLRHSWEIFRGKRRREVVLVFDPSLAPLLRSARHHPGEKVQERVDGTLEYRVTLTHLDEIARWVVGFGGKCRVEKPEELARIVRSIAEGALATVSGTDTGRL